MQTTTKGRILICALLAVFLWGCSSGPKPTQTPQKPVLERTAPQSAPPQATQPQENKAAEAKTIIPPEEKKAVEEETALQQKAANSEKDEPSALLEEALMVYQEAKLAWERSDMNAALKALDDAYKIILKVDLPADSPLLQEKNDLRLLIAQRILEINASGRNPIKGNGKSIPLVENEFVRREIELFMGGERKTFEAAYQRAGLYKDWIQEELRKAGLPEELCWLPVIESWYQARALSRARAMGMWQFMRSTGYRYGLTQDRFVDERMDPYKATQAAIKYLDELHSFFGDWTTALAAYNCGEMRVQNVINTQKVNYLDNFWDLFRRLPYETARFVPRFIGAVLIIKNPEKYGFTLPTPYPPLKFETITINHPTKLATLSAALGLESSELSYLNPELRQDSTPDHEYSLRVPVGYGEKALQIISSLPKFVPTEPSVHVVRAGETLSQIAAKYRTSVQAIVKLNGIKNPYLIRVGQRLRIPGRG